MRVGFLEPIYDGDEVVAVLNDNLVSVCRQNGTVCATGEVVWTQAEPPSLVITSGTPAGIVCVPRPWAHSRHRACQLVAAR